MISNILLLFPVLFQSKPLTLANSDPLYVQLRQLQPAAGCRVENLTLVRDAATLVLKQGKVNFFPDIDGKSAGAVFSGEGLFRIAAENSLEKLLLRVPGGASQFEEPFDSAVFYFTDASAAEIRKACGAAEAAAGAEILTALRKRLREHPESPRSFLEAQLMDDGGENLEAQLLTELLQPAIAGSFRAYLHGRKYRDLRLLIVPSGALPRLPSPEEVALLNVAPQSDDEGIWYLAHLRSETGARDLSLENRRGFAVQHYKIDTKITRGTDLKATAGIRLKALRSGDRVVPFGLLPSLRVTRVTLEGKETGFIQEGERQDGSFHVVLPEGTRNGQVFELQVEYGGDKVVSKEGNGNYSVEARTSWYPSVNSFLDRATYELSYQYPKRFVLVSVGQPVKESTDGDWKVAEWKSETPLAVAGFNYGDFKVRKTRDDNIKYDLEAYATSSVPDYLRDGGTAPQTLRDLDASPAVTMSPASLAQATLVDIQNSMRLFEHWFGPVPYGRLAVTQQPQFNFGQSWPGLIYLPISAFLDATQRWQLMGGDAFRFGQFIQEVTPHEAAHQWWGHAVGWATYHDQWLSEGFSDFAAGLFLQYTNRKPGAYHAFLSRSRDLILQKTEQGIRPNDVGPIWMGLLLNTPRMGGAYRRMVYPKGAYVLHMLRQLMWDVKSGDDDFKKMMKAFVQSHLHQNASTRSFQSVVEKHMKPSMDLEGNKSMDWFFRQWVYGTAVPRYQLEYSLKPQDGGKVLMTGKVTQADVPPDFTMQVPIYLDFDGRVTRLGAMLMRGPATSAEFQITLPSRPKRVLLNYNFDILATESAAKEI